MISIQDWLKPIIIALTIGSLGAMAKTVYDQRILSTKLEFYRIELLEMKADIKEIKRYLLKDI